VRTFAFQNALVNMRQPFQERRSRQVSGPG